MKTHIKTAPAGIYRAWLSRRYGQNSNAAGYLEAMEYARICNYDVDPFTPIMTPIGADIRATIDEQAYFRFATSQSAELALEKQCVEKWERNREFMKGEDAETILARNQAAVAADRLEAEIRHRGEQLLRERLFAAEVAARAAAFADARTELSR